MHPEETRLQQVTARVVTKLVGSFDTLPHVTIPTDLSLGDYLPNGDPVPARLESVKCRVHESARAMIMRWISLVPS